MVSFIKAIFARIWAIWVAIVFLVTTFFMWLFLVLLNHKKGYDKVRFFQFLSRGWMRTFFFFSGFRVHLLGRENIDPKRVYIFICNHRSFMDIFLMTPFIPQVNKTIGKDSFMKIPMFRTIYGSATVLVNRKDAQSRQKSYAEMKTVLEDGCSMCIYPEGTRNKTSEPLLPFQRGAFKLASELGIDIAPVVIVGSDNAISAKKIWHVLPTNVYVHFLPPIKVSKDQDADELKNKVSDIMANSYRQYTS